MVDASFLRLADCLVGELIAVGTARPRSQPVLSACCVACRRALGASGNFVGRQAFMQKCSLKQFVDPNRVQN